MRSSELVIIKEESVLSSLKTFTRESLQFIQQNNSHFRFINRHLPLKILLTNHVIAFYKRINTVLRYLTIT